MPWGAARRDGGEGGLFWSLKVTEEGGTWTERRAGGEGAFLAAKPEGPCVCDKRSPLGEGETELQFGSLGRRLREAENMPCAGACFG